MRRLEHYEEDYDAFAYDLFTIYRMVHGTECTKYDIESAGFMEDEIVDGEFLLPVGLIDEAEWAEENLEGEIGMQMAVGVP